MTTLYANPYDITATGFYFDSLEDFETKYAKHQPVEEYEIDYIDGDNHELFKAVSVGQAELDKWFELEGMDDDEQMKLAYLMEMGGYSDIDDAMSAMDDLYIFEGSPLDWAYDYIESTGMLADVPDSIANYFDYESFARDQYLTEWTYNGVNYVVEQN